MSSDYQVIVTEHGKGMKMVLGIAAAFAIPFLAPMLAGAIGLSSAVGAGLTAIGVTSATAAGTLSSVLAGAALGAGKAAIFNEDIGRGALFGGLSGGLAGYANAAKAAQAAQAAGQAGTAAGRLTDITAGLDTVGTQAITAGQTVGTAAQTAGTVAQTAGTVAQAAPTLGGTVATATGKFVETLKAMPANILAKYSDPKALADLTLRAGSMLAGAATSVDPFTGLSPEEAQLVKARQEELTAMKSADKASYDRQLSEAYKLLGRSEYFNPEYWGRAAAADAQMKTASEAQAGLRNIPVNQAARASSEARRYALGGGREQATAFQSGFINAANKQIGFQEAGLRGLSNLKYPTGATNDMIALYENDRKRRQEAQSGTTESLNFLFGTSQPVTSKT